jgi:hypothetical protein
MEGANGRILGCQDVPLYEQVAAGFVGLNGSAMPHLILSESNDRVLEKHYLVCLVAR